MNKKILSLGMAFTLGMSVLAGCTSSDSTTTTAAAGGGETTAAETSADGGETTAADAGGKKKIGVSMPTQSLERWNRDGSYLKEKFEEKGYEVKLTFSDNKIDQQVKDLEGLISDNVSLLVIAAIDGESLTQVLTDAKAANIPVISYDRLIMNTDAVSYYVSFDNYTVGKLQGQFVENALDLKNAGDKSYNIEFTAGDPADNNAGFFFNGAYDVLKPYIESGVLKVPSGQTEFDKVATPKWDTAKAMERMQNILGSYYTDTQLDVALCSNDSTALGVTQAIGTDYNGKNSVIITGQDGDVANLANIVDGKQTMTVYKAVANEAVATIDLGVALLDGKTPDAGLISEAGWGFDVAYDTESYNNNTGIIPSYLLVPTVVTKDNIQKELVDTGYYTLDDKGYPQAAQ
jgi:putative multiple sugar transport system substrate-binding protein